MTSEINPEKKAIKDGIDDVALRRAAKDGNLAEVERLIEKGTNVNAKDNDGNTPLYFAANNSHLAVAAKLLEHGTDVNAKDDGGNTPLHWAANNGDLAIVEKLIENKANVNVKNKDGNTPLHWSAGTGNLAVVEKLVEKGTNVNAKNNGGSTPLYLAEKRHYAEIADYLKSKGGRYRRSIEIKDLPKEVNILHPSSVFSIKSSIEGHSIPGIAGQAENQNSGIALQGNVINSDFIGNTVLLLSTLFPSRQRTSVKYESPKGTFAKDELLGKKLITAEKVLETSLNKFDEERLKGQRPMKSF